MNLDNWICGDYDPAAPFNQTDTIELTRCDDCGGYFEPEVMTADAGCNWCAQCLAEAEQEASC